MATALPSIEVVRPRGSNQANNITDVEDRGILADTQLPAVRHWKLGLDTPLAEHDSQWDHTGLCVPHTPLPNTVQRKASIRAELDELDNEVGSLLQRVSHFRYTEKDPSLISNLRPVKSKIIPAPDDENGTTVSSERGGVHFGNTVQVLDTNDVQKFSSLREYPNDSANSFIKLRGRRASAFEKQVLDFRHLELAKSQLTAWKAKMSTILCLLSTIAGLMAIFDVEYHYHILHIRNESCLSHQNSTSETRTALSSVSIAIKSLLALNSVLTSSFLFMYYKKECELLIIRFYLPPKATVFSSPLRKKFLIELIPCLFHIPPFADVLIPIELQLIIFFRLYLIGRYIQDHSQMQQRKSTLFLASVIGTELSPGFLVKTYFLKQPFIFISFCYLINLVGVGYLVYAADRSGNPCQYNSLLSSIWMMAVTMTTLGFGDVTPDSSLGRVFVSVSSMCGIFLMALMISVIHDLLLLTQPEKRIIAYIERQDHTIRKRELAALCIQATWRLYRFNKSGKIPPKWFRFRKLLHSSNVLTYNRGLIRRLYDVLFLWRHFRSSNSPDDYWLKDFVADNMAIQITDVARKVDLIEEILVKGGAEDNTSMYLDHPTEEKNVQRHVSPEYQLGRQNILEKFSGKVAENSLHFHTTQEKVKPDEGCKHALLWQQVQNSLTAMEERLTSMQRSFDQQLEQLREMLNDTIT